MPLLHNWRGITGFIFIRRGIYEERDVKEHATIITLVLLNIMVGRLRHAVVNRLVRHAVVMKKNNDTPAIWEM